MDVSEESVFIDQVTGRPSGRPVRIPYVVVIVEDHGVGYTILFYRPPDDRWIPGKFEPGGVDTNSDETFVTVTPVPLGKVRERLKTSL